MKRRDKIYITIIILVLVVMGSLIDAYANYVWNGYYYMSSDMLERTKTAQEDFYMISSGQNSQDRTIAVDRLIAYSDYLYNELNFELRCFIHNSSTNDKLYKQFYPRAGAFNEFLTEHRQDIIDNNSAAIQTLDAYNKKIRLLQENLNDLSSYFTIDMPASAPIVLLNPYSKVNTIIEKTISSLD